ncbi:MAG: hypothetical protein LBU65_06980, partial [Planctomycetaceae bacterium]|nr:hypothetical protein [Planctomycetaceae bacterium]
SQTPDNNIVSDQLAALKKEILAVVDEKIDVEAVAQMVEQLEFSKKLNVSLQKSFQSLQADLQRKEQTIQYLQGRINNVELDIALLKRTIVSPYPFQAPKIPPQVCPTVQTSPICQNVQTTCQKPNETHANDNCHDIHPPDFSKLRAMTVPEPTNKFTPPPKTNSGDKQNIKQ